MIENLVKEILDDSYEVEKMSGDASSRKYYRVKNGETSYVIVCDQPRSQQVVDYLRMDEILDPAIRRPQIYNFSKDFSYILLEDVGDKHLYDFKENYEQKHLNKALEDILIYQNTDRSLDIFKNKLFNDDKLSFEFEISKKYFLEKYLNIENFERLDLIDHMIKNTFQKNLVICHRDYHSKNLMLYSDDLIHIDFQDAMIGPSLYDVVSFIEDPYFEHSDKKNLKRVYFENENKYHSFDEFNDDYNITAFQRVLKALGSFTFMKYEKSKDGYMKYIKPAINTLDSIASEIDDKNFLDFVGRIKESS